MTKEFTIVSVNLSTNDHDVCGTTDIMIDEDKAGMVNGHSLFREGPNGALFIVRDSIGNFLYRHGKDSVNPGVALTSYLFGRVYMRRDVVADVDDYRQEAFTPNSGRPAAIDVCRSTDSVKPIKTLYIDEYIEYNKSKTDHEEIEMSDTKDPNTELTEIKTRIEDVRNLPKGATANCPCCGSKFTKSSSISVYCSSLHQDNKPGCKERLNSKMTNLRKTIREQGGVPVESVTPTEPTNVAVIERSPVEHDAFKTIKGIPFSLEETRALLLAEGEIDQFKKVRGIQFSLSEMRKLLDE